MQKSRLFSSGSLFCCGSFLSGCAALLFSELIKSAGQTSEVAGKSGKKHREETFAVGKVAKLCYLSCIDDGTVNETGLNSKLTLAALGILGEDSRSCGLILRNSECGSAGKVVLQFAETNLSAARSSRVFLTTK